MILNKLRKFNSKGFTLVEILVVTALFSIISLAGSMLYITGQVAWTTTRNKIILQDSSRLSLERISSELQESGYDQNLNLKVWIQNNIGENNTDILQFAVPVCPCGINPIDANGDVSFWGAPLSWGQSGCSSEYPVGNNNKVTICHLPPGNPENEHTLQVSVNAVRAHLAHGDRIGDCSSCSVSDYTGYKVEYLIDAQENLVRNVLGQNGELVNSVILNNNVTDFQVEFNAIQTAVTITIEFTNNNNNRTIILNSSLNVILRNRG